MSKRSRKNALSHFFWHADNGFSKNHIPYWFTTVIRSESGGAADPARPSPSEDAEAGVARTRTPK